MTLAFHSSQLPDGSYGGNPCGYLLTLKEGLKIYFACDTALFGDMEFIGNDGLDVAVLPIGDLFTMGPEDAVEATRLLAPRVVSSRRTITPGRRSPRMRPSGRNRSASRLEPSRWC
jgi:L-ascorbate metabolism protein UlaG (beta-lactamase superfamily)